MVRRGAAARTGDDDAGESDGGEAEGGCEANARARVSQVRLRRGRRLRLEVILHISGFVRGTERGRLAAHRQQLLSTILIAAASHFARAGAIIKEAAPGLITEGIVTEGINKGCGIAFRIGRDEAGG